MNCYGNPCTQLGIRRCDDVNGGNTVGGKVAEKIENGVKNSENGRGPSRNMVTMILRAFQFKKLDNPGPGRAGWRCVVGLTSMYFNARF